MTDKEKMEYIEALAGNARYTSNSAGFRTATECAVANALPYKWRNQFADISSFDLRFLRLNLGACDTRQAIREAGKAHKGAYFGVLRRAISDIAAANNVFAAMQASNLLRALSTKRGKKVARKAKLDIDALRKVADLLTAPSQPTLAIMSTVSYDIVKQALSHGATVTVSSSEAP